jgi:putative transposase
MRLTFKYRLYPTKAQCEFLSQQLREACDLYNCALQERRDAWKTCRKSINYYDQANQLKAMRQDGCLTLANFSCCQDVLRRLDKTFSAFFARVKRGEKPGFPRYKSSRRYDSITFPSYGDGCRLLPNGKLRTQGVGHIKVKLHRPVEGTIKTVTVKRELKRWYVCFSVERAAKPLPPSSEAVGIDVGLTTYVTLSDGAEIQNPRWFKKAQKALRIKQRRLARSKQRSNRRKKAAHAVASAHRKVFNQRHDFQHKLSRMLVNRYGLIAIENLNIKGLAGGMLAKAVHDAAWGALFQKVSYKAENARRILVEPTARGSSQECVCGVIVPKTLADRWHHCQACGLSAPRDFVSSVVILRRGLRLLSAKSPVSECLDREAACFS